MFKTIDEYLESLKTEMKDADPALVQDALADAREHLYMALEGKRESASDLSETEALMAVVEEYGSPEETAAAYSEIEKRTSPSLKRGGRPQSILGRIFGVYVDPRTWGSLLFTFITFVTGIIYFTWAVTGAALSLSFLILIIGIPFALLFLLSIRGLSLIEGRMVEALLGERMPRRPLFDRPGMKWLERLQSLLTDKRTWVSLVYLILQMPLGVIYFSVNLTFIMFTLVIMAAPIAQVFFHLPIMTMGGKELFLPNWSLVLMELGGFGVLTLTMHIIRGFGRFHAWYAKWMLVG